MSYLVVLVQLNISYDFGDKKDRNDYNSTLGVPWSWKLVLP